jgi:hypothetical protein
MPWSVRLQDEGGKPVISEDALIEFTAIPHEGEFKLLRYIDPYCDTYFNHAQMEDFLADWNKLKSAGDEQREQWLLVQNMATRCRDEYHLYLRFIGD